MRFLPGSRQREKNEDIIVLQAHCYWSLYKCKCLVREDAKVSELPALFFYMLMRKLSV